jgi:hypothetical protein
MSAPFLFVVGCERSGTTLLWVMLDAHPAMAIPDESHFLPAFRRRVLHFEARFAIETCRRAIRRRLGRDA